MSRGCAIALVGLLPIERSQIEGALVQGSSGTIPGAFIEDDLDRADLIIVNAGDAQTVNALRNQRPAGRVVLLGHTDHGTGWLLVPRPLRLQALIEAARRQLAEPEARTVDTQPVERESGRLRRFGEQRPAFSDTQPFPPDADECFVQTRQFAPQQPAWELPALKEPSPSSPGRAPLVDDFQPTRQFSHSVPSVTPSDWESEVAEWEQERPERATAPEADAPKAMKTPPAPEPEPIETPADTVPEPLPEPDRILLVGLPGPAPHGLTRLLEAEGFAVDFAASPQAMTERLARHAYQTVVLIEVSLGAQAIRLCRHVQQHPGRSSADLRLVIVASHNGLISRLRAWFAGCHAWLQIPLNPSQLLDELGVGRSLGNQVG